MIKFMQGSMFLKPAWTTLLSHHTSFSWTQGWCVCVITSRGSWSRSSQSEVRWVSGRFNMKFAMRYQTRILTPLHLNFSFSKKLNGLTLVDCTTKSATIPPFRKVSVLTDWCFQGSKHAALTVLAGNVLQQTGGLPAFCMRAALVRKGGEIMRACRKAEDSPPNAIKDTEILSGLQRQI